MATRWLISSSKPDIQDILRTPTFPTWQLQELQKNSIGYLVVDRRLVSRDAMTGYFFNPSRAAAVSLNTGGLTAGFLNGSQLVDPKVSGKFDRSPGSAASSTAATSLSTILSRYRFLNEETFSILTC